MNSALEAILGKTTSAASDNGGAAKDMNAELAADAQEPDTYRPYLAKPHPQLMFSVIERDGTTEHTFQYHTVRHPKLHRESGQEFLSFTADGMAVLMQGSGLRSILLGLKRYALSEMREYDGKPAGVLPTRIDRLEVRDAQGQIAKPAAPRLVK